ncbi:DUF3040 domain-containing protein [Streptomyces sp. ICN988]|uniref:DUF3040 domain-containing protein n=1 Tax=Streptomyces sp. ICN988 TaxID=2983765 RepID=UPI0021E50C7B|nr:DUF3040 domain-containing protein [Streptomyces sp. ICN988]MCV2458294.1 DUF3040 domain-containing protein [Streptomyces sp. ICN988]
MNVERELAAIEEDLLRRDPRLAAELDMFDRTAGRKNTRPRRGRMVLMALVAVAFLVLVGLSLTGVGLFGGAEHADGQAAHAGSVLRAARDASLNGW